MERKMVESKRPAEEIETRFVGVSLPYKLYAEFKLRAKEEEISGSALLRKLVIWYLDQRLLEKKKK